MFTTSFLLFGLSSICRQYRAKNKMGQLYQGIIWQRLAIEIRVVDFLRIDVVAKFDTAAVTML